MYMARTKAHMTTVMVTYVVQELEVPNDHVLLESQFPKNLMEDTQIFSEYSMSSVSFAPIFSEIYHRTQIWVSSNIIAIHPTLLPKLPVQLNHHG